MFGFQPIAFGKDVVIIECDGAPSFSSPPPFSSLEGSSIDYDFNNNLNNDPQNNPTSWSYTGLPPGITGNTSTGHAAGTFSAFGSYSVTVTAINDCGSADLSFTWLVE